MDKYAKHFLLDVEEAKKIYADSSTERDHVMV